MPDGTARVALVTGGARGIGAAIAQHLAADGFRLVIADRDAPSAPAANARFASCDIAEESAVSALISGINAQERRLDAMVCNAGIMIRKPIGQLSLAEWRMVLDTNLTSTFLLVRAAESMLRAAKGAILTIASTRARMSEPNTESYSASKGGLVALTHALAISLAPDVRVNAISPGWILTKGDPPRAEDHAFHPAGRVGEPDDIAALVSFLVGPQSRFITGAEFVVDGGVNRKMIYPE